MKKILQTVGILFFVVFYILSTNTAISFSDKLLLSEGTNTTHEHCFKAQPFQLFFPASKINISHNNALYSQSSLSKYLYDEYIAIVRLFELTTTSSTTQYLFSAGQFLIQFRKNDLIFPFHYFW